MRRWLFWTTVGLISAARVAAAQTPLSGDARLIADCLYAAADAYRVPPAILVVLLDVEGGSLGRVSPNTNATVDIGPMQVNQVWIPQVAAHWQASEAATFLALRDNFCANLEAGTWILRQGLDAAHGDFWQGVGTYHSHDPRHRAAYLQAVLRQVLRLRTAAETSQGRQAGTRAARPAGARAIAPPSDGR